MSNGNIKVAAVQIACHPAAYISYIMPLEVPLYDGSFNPLCKLEPLGYPVQDLKTYCKDRYISWQTARVTGIIKYLLGRFPDLDLIVFPEYSIPWQLLDAIHSALQNTTCTIVAGSHTAQPIPDALACYRKLKMNEAKIKKKASASTTAVLPIMQSNWATALLKDARSPFEKTEIESTSSQIQKKNSLCLTIKEITVEVMPLLCSEALQQFHSNKNYALTIVLSHESNPGRFGPFIEYEIANRHPVVYCNDGKYGGTGIHTIVDKRQPAWQHEYCRTLPSQEDCFIVKEIALATTAVEVGTSNPQSPHRLIGIGSINYASQDNQDDKLDDLMTIHTLNDVSVREHELSRILSAGSLNSLQKARYSFLLTQCKKGLDSSDYWNAYGNECVLSIKPLKCIESELSSYCHSGLISSLGSNFAAKDHASVAQLVEVLSGLQQNFQSNITPSSVTQSNSVMSIIDRETESNAILSFIDDQRLNCLIIGGREQIGKSTVIDKVLAQSKIPPSSYLRIQLTSTASAEYLLYRIVNGDLLPRKDVKLSDYIGKIESSLSTKKLLIIEDCHVFITYEKFRNQEYENVFSVLADALKVTGCKLILVTRRAFPDNVFDAARTSKQWIHGLDRSNVDYGVEYLNSALRNVSLSPSDYDEQDKRTIVNNLGGHPIALSLAADNIYQLGFTEVLSQIKAHVGFWKSFVDSLVDNLDLEDNDIVVLRILSAFRRPVPRELLAKIASFPAIDVCKKLLQLCLVDVASNSYVFVSSLFKVKWRVTDLEAPMVTKVHRIAAEWYSDENRRKESLDHAIEAEYHGQLAGLDIQIDTGLVDASFSSARELYLQQNYFLAKGIIDKVLLKHANRDVLRLSALIDSRCSSFDSALLKAKDVFKIDPTDFSLLFDIARAALDADKMDVLAKLVNIAQSCGVQDSRIYIVQGRMYLRQRRAVDALRAFERARNSVNVDIYSFFYLGRAYMWLGEMNSAIKVLEDGIEFYEQNRTRHPRLHSLMFGLLAQCYIWNGSDDTARQIIQSVGDMVKKNSELARAQAMLALKSKGIAAAGEAFNTLNKLTGVRREDKCSFHIYYGLYLERTGELLAAADNYDKAHRLSTTNVYVLTKLAKTYLKIADKASKDDAWLGDEGTAESFAYQCGQCVKKILRIYPNYQEAVDLQEDLYRRYNIEA